MGPADRGAGRRVGPGRHAHTNAELVAAARAQIAKLAKNAPAT